MKVCLISTRFPPFNVGGEELYVAELFRSLSLIKNFSVYDINNTFGKKFEDNKIINLSCKNNLYLGSLNLPDLHLFFKFKKVINKISPDIIHINNTHSTISTEIFFIPKKFPKVLEIHDYALFCLRGDNLLKGKACNHFEKCWQCIHETYFQSLLGKKEQPFTDLFLKIWRLSNCKLRNKLFYFTKKKFTKMALSRTNLIICPSKNVLEVCRKFGVEEKKLVYLPYGIDISKFKRETVPNERAIGFVGRLVKTKGCHVLIKAFKKVINEFPDAHLYIVGSGREEKKLNSLTKSLNLTRNVDFLGKKSKEELIDFYPRVKFFVVPSIWLETPALVTYEAMASERPVIASDMGDFSELIKHGENGLLFKLGNSADLASKIISLFKKPVEINRLGKNAFRTIKNFSLEEHNKKLIDIYKQAISLSKEKNYS